MRLVAYIRRSVESGEHTVSLQAQESAIREYAARIGGTVVGVVSHDGVSGGNRSRYDAIDAALRQTGADGVVVYHLDRLGRDTAGLLEFLERLQQRCLKLFVVGRGELDVSSPDIRLTATIEAAVAEHYRALISRKTRDALAHLKAQGKPYSRIREYGYIPEEREIITKARSLRAQGLSLRQISLELGPVSRTGGLLAPSLVHKIIKGAEAPYKEPLGSVTKGGNDV